MPTELRTGGRTGDWTGGLENFPGKGVPLGLTLAGWLLGRSWPGDMPLVVGSWTPLEM